MQTLKCCFYYCSTIIIRVTELRGTLRAITATLTTASLSECSRWASSTHTRPPWGPPDFWGRHPWGKIRPRAFSTGPRQGRQFRSWNLYEVWGWEVFYGIQPHWTFPPAPLVGFRMTPLLMSTPWTSWETCSATCQRPSSTVGCPPGPGPLPCTASETAWTSAPSRRWQ